jgi:hypothetical protein
VREGRPLGWDIVLAPGDRALGLLVLAVYGPGSTLRYGELLAAVLVRRGVRVAGWVHAIAVDDPASLRAGREVWGLPKRPATFTWRSGTVEARAEGDFLARATVTAPGGRRRALSMPVLAPFLGTAASGGDRLTIARGTLALAPTRGRLELPAASPFAGLDPWPVWLAGHARLTVPGPRHP